MGLPVIAAGAGGGIPAAAAGPCIGTCGAGRVFCCIPPLWRYVCWQVRAVRIMWCGAIRGYERKLPRSLDLNFLLSSMLKASACGTSAKEVEVRKSAMQRCLRQGSMPSLQRLKGYDYLNAHVFCKAPPPAGAPRVVQAGRCGGWRCAAAAGAGRFCSPELAAALSRNLTAMLPSFVFIMYGITVADKACRAMFYNCDKDLLRYAWYRTPGVILRCFAIRLRRVALYNGHCGCGAVPCGGRASALSAARAFLPRISGLFCAAHSAAFAFVHRASPVPLLHLSSPTPKACG